MDAWIRGMTISNICNERIAVTGIAEKKPFFVFQNPPKCPLLWSELKEAVI